MFKIDNLKLITAKGTGESFYTWDVIHNDKSATFYTDQKGQNIWQEGVKPEKTHIHNASVLDPLQKNLIINVKASTEEIKKQLQNIAESGFFTKYLK